MRAIIITMSHGNMASEMLKSAEMIMGKVENTFAIGMKDDDGLDGTSGKLDLVLEKFNFDTEILILTDLKGGTPCNVALMKMAQYKNMSVVTGLNLGMLIEALLSPITHANSLAKHIVQTGVQSIENLALEEISDTEEIED